MIVFRSVAMVSFSSSAFIRFNFAASYDKTTIENMLLAANYQATGTATGAALDLARTQLLTVANGYRVGVKTAVILVTDGYTQETASVLATAANAMKGVAEVYAVGVGADINLDELNVIAID